MAILAAAAAVALLPVAAPPATEAVVFDAFTDLGAWSKAECELTFDGTHARTPGHAALRWHISVDHTAGEPNYPIGWPRVGISPRTPFDFSGYDYLEFWVYTQSSRETLPPEPFGFIVYCGARQVATRVPAKLGEWVRVEVSVADLAEPQAVTRLNWYISESNYRHGDILDFYLADLALHRYTAPALLDFRPLEKLVDVRASYLPVDLQLVGVPTGEIVTATLVVRRDGATLATNTLALGRGRRRVVLPLPGSLPPGAAELALQLGDREVGAAPVTFVAGPFAEN